MDLDIIYEDFDIIAINKPAGIVVHPTKRHQELTLANGLSEYFISSEMKIKPRFVNRLDMNTSGILLVAKNSYAHHILSENMKKQEMNKNYIALVCGVVKDDYGLIDRPIFKEEEEFKRIVDSRGQNSKTMFKVLKRFDNYTLVELELLTGRTHQIRVHMSYLGHPLVGDELYGGDTKIMQRQALHSFKTITIQPRLKKELIFEAELPIDMKEALIKIER